MPPVNIYTCTGERLDIAAVWHAAIKATLLDDNCTVVCYQEALPMSGDVCIPVAPDGPAAMLYVQRQIMPQSGPRVFLEEDIIPVRRWSLDDYPGDYLMAEGWPGIPWPAVLIARAPYRHGKRALIPQRYVRDGGCPDWLPADLCAPALAANAKVLGKHFLHIDKASWAGAPDAAEKRSLLELLRQRYATTEPVTPPRPGLGDMVASGLAAVGITPQLVARVTGKPCACKERQAALNELGRKFGIGGRGQNESAQK